MIQTLGRDFGKLNVSKIVGKTFFTRELWDELLRDVVSAPFSYKNGSQTKNEGCRKGIADELHFG